MATIESHKIPENQGLRTARLEARITEEQKDLLSRAAALLGRSLSEFVVTCAYETAARTLREHRTLTLSNRDREVFVAALLKTPTPGARLRKAARRYKGNGSK